jgi:hypothetical protein
MALPWVFGCASSHTTAGDGRAGRSGAVNGGSGGGMVVAGAGQATNSGTGGKVSGTAGDGGSSGAGVGARGGNPSGGEAGHAMEGGTNGDPAGTGGDTSATAGDGGSGNAGGSGAPGENCRRYTAQFTVTSSSETQTSTCAFDRPSLALTCTTERGDVTTTIWATIDDAVRENQPLGTRRADRVEQYIAFPGAECRLTQDLQYDGTGRQTASLVTIDPEAPCSTNQIAYDAWAPDGRPTHGIEDGVGGEACAGGDVTVAYDDTLRTITTTRSGGTDCLDSTSVVSYDEDGFRTGSVVGSIVTTYQTLATGEICE